MRVTDKDQNNVGLEKNISDHRAKAKTLPLGKQCRLDWPQKIKAKGGYFPEEK